MVTKNNIESIESNTDLHEKSVPSRSRRGFLKKAAATGMVGLTGLTAATEAVSATESTETETTELTHPTDPSGDVGAQARNRVTITGVDDFTSYTLYTTGDVYGGEENDNIRYIPGGEVLDDGRRYYYIINGEVYGGYQDVYRFWGYVYINYNPGIDSDVDDL
ncbi:twin-arginine translocation signal domain-containing protein [Halocatena marina]|uniref:Twin-arginine translocation signal domain-containing protein n=1 Tax=Halocatena marina TaxID=2934937 RepID=A0ABD5YJ87_9EURY|nr:twin-arginine translocation signal domain-containing protein [Halocatena marina]